MSRMQKAYKREERKNQVHLTLLMDAGRGKRPARTMYKIARALDMRPSMHLMRILDEMVEEGTLIKLREEKVENVTRYVYELAPGTYTKTEPQGHQVLIRNGSKIYQERLI